MWDFNSTTNSTRIVIAVAVFFVLAVGYQFYSYQTPSNYRAAIENLRTQKDAGFKLSDESPIPDRKNFKGLKYFPAAEGYRVYANFKESSTQDTLSMTGKVNLLQRMVRVGTLEFELFKRKYELGAYQNLNREPILFVPFQDMTNGASTYKGGRYIEMPFNPQTTDKTQIELDFNKAYLPYCAYNPAYSCPIPPKENFLKIEIMAGERL